MITLRNNCVFNGFSPDYHKVRNFLIKLDNPNFHFGRWDWMVTHSYLDRSALPKIGLWEDDGQLVALATFDTQPGRTYFAFLPEYCHLKREMLQYAVQNLGKGDEFLALIPDCDTEFQQIASDCGFVATEHRESDAVFHIDTVSTEYTLPDGFSIVSLADDYDARRLGEVMWKGFDHEKNGEGAHVFNDEAKADIDAQMLRPNVDLNLKIAVAAPDGNYASFCGMWYDRSSATALVEPVATDPVYRRMGLGKAAVLEAVRRCGAMGAKRAFVGSSQQFYYSIGFRPYQTSTFWKAK